MAVRAGRRSVWRWLLALSMGVLVVLAMQRGNGGLLLLLVPLFLLGLCYDLLRRAGDAQARLNRKRSALWLLMGLAMMIGAQSYWHWRQQQRAAQAVATVQAYQQRYGIYPDSLTTAGLPAEAQTGLRYQRRATGPSLRYSATVSPLTEYVYDFAEQRWQRNTD